jgi:hypothetical protein
MEKNNGSIMEIIHDLFEAVIAPPLSICIPVTVSKRPEDGFITELLYGSQRLVIKLAFRRPEEWIDGLSGQIVVIGCQTIQILFQFVFTKGINCVMRMGMARNYMPILR